MPLRNASISSRRPARSRRASRSSRLAGSPPGPGCESRYFETSDQSSAGPTKKAKRPPRPPPRSTWEDKRFLRPPLIQLPPRPSPAPGRAHLVPPSPRQIWVGQHRARRSPPRRRDLLTHLPHRPSPRPSPSSPSAALEPQLELGRRPRWSRRGGGALQAQVLQDPMDRLGLSDRREPSSPRAAPSTLQGVHGEDPRQSVQGGWGAGDQRWFQVWYRDTTGPCNGQFNTSSGLDVTFDVLIGAGGPVTDRSAPRSRRRD